MQFDPATKSNKRGVNRRASHNKSPASEGIPSFNSDAVHNWVSRFSVTDGNSVVEPTLELPIYPWGMSTSTTTMRLPFKAIRLARVRIWGNYDSDTSMGKNSVSLTFLQRREVRPIEISDSATPFKLAYIDYKCKPSRPEGRWYYTRNSENNPEINFRLTPGAILELHFQYVLCDGESVQLATAPTSGLTADLVYTNRLLATLEPIARSNAAVIEF